MALVKVGAPAQDHHWSSGQAPEQEGAGVAGHAHRGKPGSSSRQLPPRPPACSARDRSRCPGLWRVDARRTASRFRNSRRGCGVIIIWPHWDWKTVRQFPVGPGLPFGGPGVFFALTLLVWIRLWTSAKQLRHFRGIDSAGSGRRGPKENLLGERAVRRGRGLGSPLAMYLAAAGIGKPGIVDRCGRVLDSAADLHGHRGRRPAKTESARRTISRLKPGVEVVLHEVRLTGKDGSKSCAPMTWWWMAPTISRRAI